MDGWMDHRRRRRRYCSCVVIVVVVVVVVVFAQAHLPLLPFWMTVILIHFNYAPHEHKIKILITM